MSLNRLRVKKGEDRRLRSGHPWVFSNEIATNITPLTQFKPGEEVIVEAHDKTILGVAYVNPHSLISARLFSRHPDERLNAAFFQHKIGMALEFRERLFDKPFYRMVFSEADQLPGLIVDCFDHHFVVQTNTAGMEHKQPLIAEALSSLIPDTSSILLKNDSSIRELEGLPQDIKPLYGNPPDEVDVVENSVRFRAPLFKGQKTAWFYDHRYNRARLRDYVQGKNVLDVFSYLGAFGIQAACFGATHVTCIETSDLACAYQQKNAELNNVDHKITAMKEEAFVALKALAHENNYFDVIVLDPPAFVKKLKDRDSGLLAYQRLNALALKLLNPNGILVSCSCSMHVSLEDLTKQIRAAAQKTDCQLQIIEQGHQAPDHPIHICIPETNYLKALFLRKLA